MREGVSAHPFAPFASVALVALVASLFAGCSSKSAPSDAPSNDAGGDGAPVPRTVTAGSDRYERAGPHPVGHATFTAIDEARGRPLRFELWYPADESARAAASAGTKLEDLEPAGASHDALAKLVAAAPKGCTRRMTSSVADAPPAPTGAFPLVVFSHCHDCMRFSALSIGERLASHGVAMIAPDHAGNTLWDHLAGVEAPIDKTTLATRVGDVRFALDVALVRPSDLPAQLRGRFDATKVGALGHSFGSATTGAVAAQEPRIKAAFGIAAPFESALLPPTKMADIHVPVFFLLAQEDNSITEIGNGLIRQNFKIGASPIWLAEVADAGHWSFSDVCGLTDSFSAGCGVAQRQTDSTEVVAYLDNEGARGLAASYAAAFFAAELQGDEDGKAFLGAPHPKDLVTLSAR